jgi:hypothetical protein
MFAETVHTIFLSLPESEQKRFMRMVQVNDKKPKQKATNNAKFSKENCLNIAASLMKKKGSGNHATPTI